MLRKLLFKKAVEGLPNFSWSFMERIEPGAGPGKMYPVLYAVTGGEYYRKETDTLV
jgi:hypothetical protein